MILNKIIKKRLETTIPSQFRFVIIQIIHLIYFPTNPFAAFRNNHAYLSIGNDLTKRMVWYSYQKIISIAAYIHFSLVSVQAYIFKIETDMMYTIHMHIYVIIFCLIRGKFLYWKNTSLFE